ncbi:MAG: DUF4240 domain-containing protein [Bacteroidota bacterium]
MKFFLIFLILLNIKGENKNDSIIMDEKTFWNVIEQKGKSTNDLSMLINKLSLLQEDEIISFEIVLRQKLVEINTWESYSICRILEGMPSEDNFLYFRCWIILQGESFFNHFSDDPNSVSEEFIFLAKKDFPDGAHLLYVSDQAFEMKFGQEHSKKSPRDYAMEIIDYDFEEHPLMGEKIEYDDIKNLFPKIWEAFSK